MTAPPRRVAVLGGAGAGKSTLARRLGEALDAPVVHLDRLAFGPGWARLGAEAFRARLGPLVDAPTWVVEGTYPEVAGLVLARADLTLWLDQPFWRRLWRAWRKSRIHQDRPRADRPDGCEEAFGRRYAWQVMRFGGWSAALERRLTRSTNGAVERLRGDAGVRRFLDTLVSASSPAARGRVGSDRG